MRAFTEVVGDCNSDSNSDCEFEFGFELEFQHGVVSFFGFCEHTNHSTIVQPVAHNVNATTAHTHLRCNQSAAHGRSVYIQTANTQSGYSQHTLTQQPA